MRLRLLAMLAVASAVYGGTSDTFDTVPQANASFQSDLQTFLRREDAERYHEQFASFIPQVCLGTSSASLTHTPTSCLGYPGGYRTTETGSITYPSNSTCWVLLHKDTTGNVT